MNFRALYDACVLYPAQLRDLLLEVALADLVDAKWSDQIQEEWVNNLLKSRSDLSREKLNRTVELMLIAVPDALVTNYKEFIHCLDMPDTDDRHVLAAAIRCNADVIVTFNLKDFPVKVLSKYQLEAVHPDVFLVNQLDLSQSVVISCVKRIRARLNNPSLTPTEYLERLASVGLPAFADRMTENIELF